MSQKVRILGVRVSSPVYLGSAETNAGDRASVWSADPDEVMAWLCGGFRYRFNSFRAWRGRYVWEDDPDRPGERRKMCFADGTPVLVALGSDPVSETIAHARQAHDFLAAVPDMVLQAPERLENEEWRAAIKRRATNQAKGAKGGRMPGMRRRSEDARFACWFNGGRNAVLHRTGKRSGIVAITGQNPAGKRGNHPVRWSIQLRVRLSQPIRAYTSVRVNWTRRELVFTNPPVGLAGRQPTGAMVGLDVGVTRTIATSDGAFFDAPDTADLDARIRYLQRRMAKARLVAKVEGRDWRQSTRYTKTRRRCRELQAARTRRLDDWRHKTTTGLVRDHDLIAIEALKVKNMTHSAKGTIDSPGKNVRAKAGLNRGLASAAFATLRAMLEYKAKANGVTVVPVPPRNTSRTCHQCGHTAAENRESQAVFCCVNCGHTANADTHAANNILTLALNLNQGPDREPTGSGRAIVCPAGSKRKTDPSKKIPALGPDGSCNEPRTTHHAAA